VAMLTGGPAPSTIGAALAALGAGTVRTATGYYSPAFWISGGICFLTGIAFLFTRRTLARREPSSAAAPVPLHSTTLA